MTIYFLPSPLHFFTWLICVENQPTLSSHCPEGGVMMIRSDYKIWVQTEGSSVLTCCHTDLWLHCGSHCIAGNWTWLYRLPQSQIIMYSLFIRHTATVWKIKQFSSSAPGLSMMTLRECNVDCPFPVTWLGNVWEPVPPPPQYRSKPTI
jgi:hypothetical protein